jgi:hypothetical protein
MEKIKSLELRIVTLEKELMSKNEELCNLNLRVLEQNEASSPVMLLRE